jgi:hypothetical protein
MQMLFQNRCTQRHQKKKNYKYKKSLTFFFYVDVNFQLSTVYLYEKIKF